MNRYSLAWACLGAVGLAASVAWWWAGDVPSRPAVGAFGAAAPSDESPLVAPHGAPLREASFGARQASNPRAALPQSTLNPGSPDALAAPAHGDVLSAGFVSASLQALSAHGVRLNQPQVSLHTVQTIDLPAAKTLSQWARAQGFAVRAPIKVLEHGGEVNWVLPIERHAVLEVAQILADGQQIRARAQQTPGARYHTWQVPVGGRSTLAGAAQS